MPLTFREFLKQKAGEYAEKAKKNEGLVTEWQEAVERLLNQLETWLTDADQDGVIKHHRKLFELAEPGLGRYPMSRWDIRAFGVWVGVIPKARRTARRAPFKANEEMEQSTGRVDITNDITRYALYRFGEGDTERWFIEDIGFGGDIQPLTSQAFDTVLMSFFL